MDVSPFIPFWTGAVTSITSNTRPEELAAWVREEDRVPLILALSLYTGVSQGLDGFELIPNSLNGRVAAWFNNFTGHAIVGLKGTTLSTGNQDIHDDKIVAGLGSSYCDLTIVREASILVDQLMPQTSFIIFAGHSLGGTAALCLACKYPLSRSISLNGGAAPTNPILSGPGATRSRFYHIFGDLISSHMSPQAAEIIRIRKSDDTFDIFYHHSSDRILASDGFWQYATADQEDYAYKRWGDRYSAEIDPVEELLTYTGFLRSKSVHLTTPIPGSYRWSLLNRSD